MAETVKLRYSYGFGNRESKSVFEVMMRLNSHRGPILAALLFIFFLVAASVNGQQDVPATATRVSQDTSQSQTRAPASVRMDCTYLGNALRATQQRVEHDERILTAGPQPAEAISTTGGWKNPTVNLLYD